MSIFSRCTFNWFALVDEIKTSFANKNFRQIFFKAQALII